MSKKMPQTSRDAFRSFNPAKINEIHIKILAAMQYVGPCTYEEIASYLNMEPQRIWRRMSELGSAQKIHRPGGRKIMKSGRQGMIWVLGPSPESVKKKERVMKGKSVSDFSKAILKQPSPSTAVQKQIF